MEGTNDVLEFDEVEEHECGIISERNLLLPDCSTDSNVQLGENPGCSRVYDLYVPLEICDHFNDPKTTYVGGLVPMVFAVHCQYCLHKDMYDWLALAEQYQFVAVVPHGYEKDHTFNGQQCCGEAVEQNIDDVTFFEKIIEDLDTEFDFVSKDFVYGYGYKNGGYMVARAANLFRAIAPSGGYHVELPELKNPVGLFLTHAKDDIEARITGCCAANEDDENKRCSGGVAHLLDTCTSAQDFVENFGRDVNHCKSGNEETYHNEDMEFTCYDSIDCLANTTMCIFEHHIYFEGRPQDFPMTTDVANFFARDACLSSQESVWVPGPVPKCVCKDADSTQIYCLNAIKPNGFNIGDDHGSNNEVGDHLPLFITIPFCLTTVVLMVIAFTYYRRRNGEEDKQRVSYTIPSMEMARMMEDDAGEEEEDTPAPRVRLSGRI